MPFDLTISDRPTPFNFFCFTSNPAKSHQVDHRVERTHDRRQVLNGNLAEDGIRTHTCEIRCGRPAFNYFGIIARDFCLHHDVLCGSEGLNMMMLRCYKSGFETQTHFLYTSHPTTHPTRYTQSAPIATFLFFLF